MRHNTISDLPSNENMTYNLKLNKSKAIYNQDTILFLKEEPNQKCSDVHYNKSHAKYCLLSKKYLIFNLFILCILNFLVAETESKCFSVPNNLTIAGADYRQSVGIPLLTCARGCFDDVCCMAYEWTYENSGTCTHKSRSLNGTLVHKSNAVFGICLDEDDEERENLADHVIEGRLTALPTHTMRIDCEDYCAKFDDTTMYSWHGDNYHGGPETNGDCFCLGVLQGILLQFGSSAGFIINK